MKFAIPVLICGSPYILWLIPYLANPQSPLDLRVKIARMRRLRWISYIAGVALGAFSLVEYPSGKYWIFGTFVIGASAGLEIPMGWLKKRLALSEKQGNQPLDVIPHEG
jgi:polyferredoxin